MNANQTPPAPAHRRERTPRDHAVGCPGRARSRSWDSSWPDSGPGRRVETAVVTVGVLRATVNEEGRTRIRQRYVVSAPVAGQLRRLAFKAGDEIRADDTVLAVIEPAAPTMLDARERSLAEARRDSASASLEKSRAAHAFAASELRRFEKLSSDKTVSPQELETAQFRESSSCQRDLSRQERPARGRGAIGRVLHRQARHHQRGLRSG